MLKLKNDGLFNDSQIKLIELLIQHGEIDVDDASKEIGVSKATIYNYYNYMNNLIFERIKGKIRLRIQDKKDADSNLNESFLTRLSKNEKMKTRAAIQIASEIISQGDVIFLDCGSANLFIADQIIEHQIQDLKVVTNNPYVFNKLHKYDGLSELSVIGGIFSGSRSSFYGGWTDALLTKIKDSERFKKAFIGADGLSLKDDKGLISLVNSEEKQQKLKIMSMSDEIYFPLDFSKMGRVGTILVEAGDENWNKITAVVGSDNDEHTAKIKKYIGLYEKGKIIIA